MSAGGLGISPDAAEHIGIGEGAGTIGGKQQVDLFLDQLGHYAGVVSKSGSRRPARVASGRQPTDPFPGTSVRAVVLPVATW